MPTLDFKGKQVIYSYHFSVPLRELVVEPDGSLPAAGGRPSLDDNLIKLLWDAQGRQRPRIATDCQSLTAPHR